MLLEFSCGNYRSFFEKKTLDLRAASISEYSSNVFSKGSRKLLKLAALYGANSSGKSNLIQGMKLMKKIVSESASLSSSEELPYEPFLLDVESQKSPTHFEAILGVEEKIYRYGFEYSRNSIEEEWLFEVKKTTESVLFYRIKDGIEVKKGYKEGAGLEEKTRDNALFLSVVDQFNGTISKAIMRWFYNFNVIHGLQHRLLGQFTYSMLKKPEEKQLLLSFYKKLDLGFQSLKLLEEEITPETFKSLPKELIEDFLGSKRSRMLSVHNVYQNGKAVDHIDFDVSENESAGTQKLIDLSGPVFDTLSDGGVLIVDELDAKLHPILTLEFVRLFHNTETNPLNAQLVFATHDTNLLSHGKLRRDQIFFIEKDECEQSDLYSLVEYDLPKGKKVRKDMSFEKDYLLGRYGAIPFLGPEALLPHKQTYGAKNQD